MKDWRAILASAEEEIDRLPPFEQAQMDQLVAALREFSEAVERNLR